jgi:hypothetical protein
VLADMISWRNRLTPALGVVAVLFLLVALFLRPQPLPPNAAQYKAAVPPILAKTNRKATLGVTYAIDSLEADGIQHPITGATITTSNPLILHGWAVTPDSLTPGQVLLVSIDGAKGVPDPSYGMARPDVGAAINPSATKSGFGARIPVAGLKRGPHRIHLVLEDAIGRDADLSKTVTFTLR